MKLFPIVVAATLCGGCDARSLAPVRLGMDAAPERLGPALQVVTMGANSAGCATSVAVNDLSHGSVGLIVGSSGAGLFFVIALEGEGPSAPTTSGVVTASTGRTIRSLSLLSRHSSGNRTHELWWLPPPNVLGSPTVYTMTGNLTAASYVARVAFTAGDVNRIAPIGGEAFTDGTPAHYPATSPVSTTLRQTHPRGLVVDFLSGALDADLSAPDHFCGTGHFELALNSRPCQPGGITVTGNLTTNLSSPSYLHSAWEIRPSTFECPTRRSQ